MLHMQSCVQISVVLAPKVQPGHYQIFSTVYMGLMFLPLNFVTLSKARFLFFSDRYTGAMGPWIK